MSSQPLTALAGAEALSAAPAGVPVQAAAAAVVNAMSIDVEDYFQVQAFADHIDRADWPGLDCRVERNVDTILGLLADSGRKATFFTLGWIAERHRPMVRRIVEGGHELASHGYAHFRADSQTPPEFAADVGRTKAILEDIGGVPVLGYRAASFSVGAGNLWAHEVLAEQGYAYSSSIYPIRHDLYGMPDAPRFPYNPPGLGRFVEWPVTTATVFGRNVPCGGGGYFRLLPYGLSRWLMRRVNEEGKPCIFYFHPWEVDPGQPRQHGVSLKTRVRHYTNLGRMEARLRRLLGEFAWGRVDHILAASHGPLH